MAKAEKTFGVTELAEELSIEPATARVQLRAAGIEKDGKAYSWNQTGFQAVVKKLKSGNKTPAKKQAVVKAKPAKGKAKSKPAKEVADEGSDE